LAWLNILKWLLGDLQILRWRMAGKPVF